MATFALPTCEEGHTDTQIAVARSFTHTPLMQLSRGLEGIGRRLDDKMVIGGGHFLTVFGGRELSVILPLEGLGTQHF